LVHDWPLSEANYVVQLERALPHPTSDAHCWQTLCPYAHTWVLVGEEEVLS
jgi:hypothetical protein